MRIGEKEGGAEEGGWAGEGGAREGMKLWARQRRGNGTTALSYNVALHGPETQVTIWGWRGKGKGGMAWEGGGQGRQEVG